MDGNPVDPTYFALTAVSDVSGASPPRVVSDIFGDTTGYGDEAFFIVALLQPPTGDVRIPLESSNAAEGTVAAEVVLNAAKRCAIIPVSGVEDAGEVDGDQSYTAITGLALSSDPKYTGVASDGVAVMNKDNDADKTDILVTPVFRSTAEGGRLTAFLVELSSKAAAPVNPIFDCTSGLPQIFFVRGVDNNFADGDIGYNVVLAPTVSADPGKNIIR